LELKSCLSRCLFFYKYGIHPELGYLCRRDSRRVRQIARTTVLSASADEQCHERQPERPEAPGPFPKNASALAPGSTHEPAHAEL
ncbi:MAG: hypothetical protein JW751_15995, partial [Polyangiaceae bacterium]|nr:hypothetical protein [Polyangiaceae bacterium]